MSVDNDHVACPRFSIKPLHKVTSVFRHRTLIDIAFVGPSVLHFEAWSLTREEFRVSQLPSVAAIQRSIVKILESLGASKSISHAFAHADGG